MDNIWTKQERTIYGQNKNGQSEANNQTPGVNEIKKTLLNSYYVYYI